MFVMGDISNCRVLGVYETKKRVVNVCQFMRALIVEDMVDIVEKLGSCRGVCVTFVQEVGFVLDVICVFVSFAPSADTVIFWGVVATTKFYIKAMGTYPKSCDAYSVRIFGNVIKIRLFIEFSL